MPATVWLDIVFVPLFVAGVETITIVGRPGGYGNYGVPLCPCEKYG
jgi:hypothetical protein